MKPCYRTPNQQQSTAVPLLTTSFIWRKKEKKRNRGQVV